MKDSRVIGLSGGRKQLWLKQHRVEVMAFYSANGPEATMQQFVMKQDTLERFLNPTVRRSNTKLSKADRATIRAQIAEEGLRDVRAEVRELKAMYNQFVPYLADELKEKFFKPLLTGKIELPPELEHKPRPDPLSLTDFEGSGNK